MKNFNKQIEITVELDSIANLLLFNMSPHNVNAESIVEVIIGRLDAKDDTIGLTMLYNALNNFSNDINFQIGNVVKCDQKAWGYWTPESVSSGSTVNQSIGVCTVVDIDIYRDNKIQIEFDKPDRKGVLVKETAWVSHTSCKIMSLVAQLEAGIDLKKTSEDDNA